MTQLNDFHDEDSNTSNNPSIHDMIHQRQLSRRSLIGSGAALAAAGSMGLGLTACSDDDDSTPAPTTPGVDNSPLKALGFTAVTKTLADVVTIPEGYQYDVIVALGDPILAGAADYKNDGTDADFDKRSGDHHDGMEWFGLDAAGKASTTSVDRGLLATNHEATTNANNSFSSFFIHANGGTNTLPRPASEVDKEIDIHGLAVVEVKKADNKWAAVRNSSFNARITPLTELELSGPVKGNALVVTKFSTDGSKCRGTLNNCGTGKTPWGTFLTGEENWAGYFTRNAEDDLARGDKSVVALKRYGRSAGAASRHAWETAGTADKYQRWNIGVVGDGDAKTDYRNELNTFGYIVEMDAYDKTKKLKKRTALGRFAHESASFGIPVAGKPLAVYMGDDSRNEYMYKFVSTALWNPADANATDRLAIGDKYLDSGKLYVAKFNAEGTGVWIELSITNEKIANYSGYDFADQADVFVNARLAADAVGATKMDRPEWGGVNPANGEFYITLTNNSRRVVEPPVPISEQDKDASLPNSEKRVTPDGANPRAYTDLKNGAEQKGNSHGHILRVKETNGNASVGFSWDIYLFGAEADADTTKINMSKLSADQDFSSPDGLAFSANTGVCWIQTDDSAYTDVTNCMLLAAIPGTVGDGSVQTLSYDKADGSKLHVATVVGSTPAENKLKRFLVGPKDCEITGFCETPDGKAIFINIQHPGENTDPMNIAFPSAYSSQWPANKGYGSGKRPRSATIVITKKDGGRIGT